MYEDALPALGSWTEQMLGRPTRVRDKKAIHDQVLGTHVFEPHEVAILNTPLLQRLRYISQTGFVYLTFPGARHSRFEHTIGTAVLVERFARALNSQARKPLVGRTELQELRVAALLHDVGHGFFSHASELVYRHLDVMKQCKKMPDFSHKGAGEILSYGIVTSQPFRQFFDRLISDYNLGMNLDRIAEFILGLSRDPERAYLSEIISGPFDVDKLDYIHRDAHATGLRLVVDLERFFYAITVAQVDGHRRLAIRAIEPLEQLIFSKMLLYATVYHHQKVKACDCLLRGAVEWARRNNQPLCGRPMQSATDFLALTDIDFLSCRSNPLVRRLAERDLLYRAAAICPETVQNWTEKTTPAGVFRLRDETRFPQDPYELSMKIHGALPDALRSRVLPEEIWVDIPEKPNLEELSFASIVRRSGIMTAERVFPTQGWLNAYGTFRSRGHLYAPREYLAEVFSAAQEVFRQRYGLRFRFREVRTMCHWPRTGRAAEVRAEHAEGIRRQ